MFENHKKVRFLLKLILKGIRRFYKANILAVDYMHFSFFAHRGDRVQKACVLAASTDVGGGDNN